MNNSTYHNVARLALDLARSSLRYAPVLRDEQAALARRIEELAGAHPRYGYRRIWALLDREGWSVNKKAVRRIWRQSGLKLAQPQAVPKPRRPHGQDRNACHLRPSRGKDDVWTWDFIFDRTSDGRSLKWLSLVDEYTRECLALEARRGMTAEDIRIILAEVAAGRGGPPCRLRSDNGPEFVAQVVRSWLEGTGSGPLYVAPGSPWQNGYAESFHSKVRDEFLDREEFESEPQARALGAPGRGSIIRNARTVPWDTEHRPNSRRPARGMCLSKKTRPIPRLLNERPGDSHYHWTKKWGAGQQLNPQHPSPFRSTQIHLGDQVVRQERDKNAQHNVELLGRHKTPAKPRRRDLGDVQRRDDRRTADRQSTQQPEGEKRIPIPCQSAAQRPNKIEDGQDHERPLSSPRCRRACPRRLTR